MMQYVGGTLKIVVKDDWFLVDGRLIYLPSLLDVRRVKNESPTVTQYHEGDDLGPGETGTAFVYRAYDYGDREQPVLNKFVVSDINGGWDVWAKVVHVKTGVTLNKEKNDADA
jgi:hypothetical protein